MLYPKNIVQSILLLVMSVLLGSPIIFLQQLGFVQMQESLFNQILFLWLIAVISILYFFKNRNKISFRQFFALPNRLPFKVYALAVLFVIVFLLGLDIPLTKYIVYHTNGENITNPFDDLPLFLGTVFIGPFCEEVVFRGMILRGFLLNYSVKNAVLWSGIIFTLVHVVPALLFGSFVLGLLFGGLYFFTKSIWPGMFFHILANFTALFAGLSLYKLYGIAHVEFVYGYYFTITIAVLSTFLCMGITYKLVKSFQ